MPARRRYAAETPVPVAQTQEEIRALVEDRYAAAGYGVYREGNRHMIAFKMHDRQLRFVLTLPDSGAARYADYARVWHQGAYRDRRRAVWEQEVRALWRALYLTIKAKLVSVDSGVEQFEDAFMSQIVVPDGQGGSTTVGELLRAQISEAYRSGRVPALLPPAPTRPILLPPASAGGGQP